MIPRTALIIIWRHTTGLLRQRFGVVILADVFIIVSGVKFGAISAPGRAFDRAVDVATPCFWRSTPLAAFNQSHNSLNGGCAGQGGIEEVPPTEPPPALLAVPPPAALPDPELLRVP